MAKKPKNQQLFKAQTMGSYQRQLARAEGRADSRKAVEQTSTITVLKPDESGNFVEVEVLAPVRAKTPAPRRRPKPKVPRGAKSLL